MDALLELKRIHCLGESHGYMQFRYTKGAAAHKRIRMDFLLRYVGGMPLAEARAFLEKTDNDGVSVREHARGMAPWAPCSVAFGLGTIRRNISRFRQQTLLLFELKELWFASDHRGRKVAMATLLLRTLDEPRLDETSLFSALHRLAVENDCLEDMKTAASLAMVAILLEKRFQFAADHETRFLEIVALLDLGCEHALICDRQGRCLLHCPMPLELMTRVFLGVTSADLDVRMRAGALPAECWLLQVARLDSGAFAQWLVAFTALLERGASVDFAGSKLRTPAVVYGRSYERLLRLLLSHGADASLADWQGLTAVSALGSLSCDFIRELVKRGANLSHAEGCLAPPLVESFRVGFQLGVETIETVVELGCDLNLCNDEGQNVLFFATSAEEVEALVHAGVDPAIRDHASVNPLHAFIINSQNEPPECLLVPENLNTVTQRLGGFQTPAPTPALGWCVVANKPASVFIALVDAGALVDGPPDSYPPVLVGAHRSRMAAGCEILIKLGASLPEDIRERFPHFHHECEAALKELVRKNVGSSTKRA